MILFAELVIEFGLFLNLVIKRIDLVLICRALFARGEVGRIDDVGG